MKTLHTINKSVDTSLLERWINSVKKEDQLVFLENGVLCLIESSPTCNTILTTLSDAVSLFYLEDHAQAFGVTTKLIDTAKSITYDHFVTLTERNDRIVSWF